MKKRARDSRDNPENNKIARLSDSPPEIDLTNIARNVNKDVEAIAGIIERISVKNFMCHNRLDFNFSPNTNFIIGRNGSGKSAILAAAVVGLGGKATTTSRGSSVKNFIQNGKHAAEISIKLRNCGDDAFKPEKYGKSIIVERRLASDGSSNYKLKSEKGELISNKREELTSILDQFNIQVDNPVCILNQDMSKNFLQSKNSQDKYKFFLKATQLEQMKTDYSHAVEQKKIARNILNQKEQTLPELQKEVQDWKRKWKFHQSLEDLRKKVDNLKKELLWAHVTEREKALDKELKVVTSEKNRLPKFQNKVQESKAKVDGINRKINDNQTELTEISNEVSVLQPQHDEAKSEMTGIKSLHRQKQLDLRKITNELHGLMKEKDQLSSRIKELRTQAQQDNSEEKEVRTKRLDKLNEDKKSISSQLDVHELFCNNLKITLNENKEKIYQLGREEQDLKYTIDQKKRNLQNLEGSQHNQLKRFGNFVPDLIQKIEQAHRQKRFVKKPVGPVGSFLKLTDSRWSLAVEMCLGSLMFAFCCHCHEDSKVLEDLMRSVINEGRKPTIIISPFQERMYDVRGHAVQQGSEFESILSALIIDDPVVANLLIDQRGIENVLLIHDNDIARRVMSDERGIPRNCHEAFTADGDHIYPAPNYSWYSSNKSKAVVLRESVVDHINEIKDEVRNCEIKRQEVNAGLVSMKSDCRSNESDYTKSQDHIRKLRHNKSKIEFEITELLNIEDPEPVDVAALEDELMLINTQVNEQTLNKSNVEGEYKGVKDIYNAVHDNFGLLDAKLNNIMLEKYEPLKDQIASFNNELAQAKSHLQHYEGKLKEHTSAIDKMQKEYDKQKTEVDSLVKESQETCERVQTKRAAQNINNEILHITKQLQSKDKHHGTQEEVTKNYHETKLSFKKIQKDVSNLDRWLESLESAMTDRNRSYSTFRQMLSMRVKYMFITSLTQAEFNGQIAFNHDKQELYITVQPKKDVAQAQTDMKSLSGGERSFSTISFVLALWGAMESPFRMLDEFDVFMDMVNRRISMEMMLATATRSLDHQFIFLTPLNMTKLKCTNCISIFRMKDPDRNQSVLPFRNVQDADKDDDEH